jgi:hypothetical protein
VLGGFAQPRRLERAVIDRILRDREAAVVLELLRAHVPSDPEIVKLPIGEIAADMALHAPGTVEEEIVPTLGGGGHRVLLVLEAPPIVRRVAAHPRTLVVGDRLRHALLGDLLAPERFLEVRLVAGDRRE